MARKHFYEILSDMKFDYQKEFDRLYNLIFVDDCISHENHYFHITFETFINEELFREFKYRGTYLSFGDMLKTIFYRFPKIDSTDDLLLFCEIFISIIEDGESKLDYSAKKQAKTIYDNINCICEKTNHEVIEKNNNEFIIVEKSKEATQAAELVEDTSVAIEILEYNHYTLRGDLDEKRKILTSLGNYIEPILKSRLLQQNGYGKLESDTGFLLNNFHIRHNNKAGAKAQEYITKINDLKLEEWYDICYNSILSVIIIKEQIQTTQELNELKKKYTWKS